MSSGMKRKGGPSFSHGGNKSKKPKSTKEEIREMMETVKEFTAKSLEGAKRLAHKDDKLTRLGALPPKQQKMPYHMKIGLNAAKKKRDIRNAELAKESQVQLPQSYGQQSKKKRK